MTDGATNEIGPGRDGSAPFGPATCSVRMCQVCGRSLTEKRYDHENDHRTYWTCDLAEGAWAHGAQHTAEDAPENRKSPNARTETRRTTDDGNQ